MNLKLDTALGIAILIPLMSKCHHKLVLFVVIVLVNAALLPHLLPLLGERTEKRDVIHRVSIGSKTDWMTVVLDVAISVHN